MIPAREGTSTREVVPAGDGARQRKEERGAREDASAQEGPQLGDEAEEAQVKLPLVVVPFERSVERERPAQTRQPARARMLWALENV